MRAKLAKVCNIANNDSYIEPISQKKSFNLFTINKKFRNSQRANNP